MFPYREGLSFEQDVWMDQGQAAAFTGALDRPPTSSWEIINPRDYEKGHLPAVPLLPDIHPLVDKLYRPYDIGQVGQLDLHILAGIFGGDGAARDLTPAWDGGLYWAGQRRSANTPAEQASTASIALLYLSVWKNPASAHNFVRLYAEELGRKYSGLKPDEAAQRSAPPNAHVGAAQPVSDEQVYSTNEGPVVITTRGKLVLVTESFDLDLARKLAALILDAQGTGAMQLASAPGPSAQPRLPSAPSLCLSSGARVGYDKACSPGTPALASEPSVPLEPLTASLVRFLSSCGVTKAAADAALQVGRSQANDAH
jgi:hypothetical protein